MSHFFLVYTINFTPFIIDCYGSSLYRLRCTVIMLPTYRHSIRHFPLIRHSMAFVVVLLLNLVLAVPFVFAAPLTPLSPQDSANTELNTADNPSADSTNTDSTNTIDPQVAPQADSPFLPETSATEAVNTTADAKSEPNSFGSSMQPSKLELYDANQALLSQNAQLQRDVNDLETRVNVLINERSGQLFLYGAISVGVSLIVGFMIGAFIFSRRSGNW